jgi:hypothetical protein
MTQTARQAFPIKVINGVEYADPLHDERYLVRFYDLPPKDDLTAYIKLIESFERRFFYTADHGQEAMRHRHDIDDYVSASRKAYEAANGKARDLAAGTLSMALLERGIERAKQHIRLRIDGVKIGDPRLDELEKGVGADLNEGLEHFPHVRRKRGHMDIDDVLNEMKGEPYNVFVGTLPKADGLIHMFHQNRFRKAAKAMKCMDAAADAIAPVAASHPQFEKAGIPALIKELAKYAKIRVQLERSDPEFKDIDEKLSIVRNELQAFKPVKQNTPDHLPADHAANANVSPTAVELIRDATDIIYDMAIIRGDRWKSTANLKERSAEHLQAMGRANTP